MDQQLVFDAIVRFIRLQGGPSRQKSGCFYRSADGRKSVIGCLLPDALYADYLEDRDPEDLPPFVFDALGAETEDDIGFLVELEEAHDTAARAAGDHPEEFWLHWTKALKRIAARHSLTLIE